MSPEQARAAITIHAMMARDSKCLDLDPDPGYAIREWTRNCRQVLGDGDDIDRWLLIGFECAERTGLGRCWSES